MNLEINPSKKNQPINVVDDLDFDFKPITSGLGFHHQKTTEVKPAFPEMDLPKANTNQVQLKREVRTYTNAAPVYQNDLSLFYGHELKKEVPAEEKIVEKTYHLASASQRIIAYILRKRKINYLILENNHRVVRIEKNNGFNIYYGDAMNIEILNYIGLSKAESVVVALDDEIACIKITRFIHQNFPTVAVITKSETFNNADRFRKVGASYVVSKNLETGLQLSHAALSSVGVNSAEVSSIISSFRDINNDALKDLILFNEDEENEKEYLQNAKRENLKNSSKNSDKEIFSDD
jgi:voltage-gated potassium channel Kch